MIADLVTLLVISFTSGLALVIFKILDQERRDHARRTYRLAFPADLAEDRVAAWLHSISGTLQPSSTHFKGTPSIVFEVSADNRTIIHRIKVPWQHADYVITQLRSLVSGIRVTPEENVPHHEWTRAVEVGMTQSSRPLRIFSSVNLAASLLASLQALGSDEHVLIQWVVTPAVPSHPPDRGAKTHNLSARNLLMGAEADKDEIGDRRKKLEEPNMLCVLRIGAMAKTPVRADHLIYRVRASLASTRSHSTRFVRRLTITKTALQKRIDNAVVPIVSPIQLTTSELTGLIAWPLDNPSVQGLPPAMSRHLPADESIPREGRVIGMSTFPGNERPIAVSFEGSRKHMYAIGPTGVGKSALLANLMRQDMLAGYGVILIENKGDLFHAALNYVPKSRLKDVVILDVNDTTRPIGFNILQQGSTKVAIDELCALFENLYDTRGVWSRSVLYHGLRTLGTDPSLCFVDLAPLLIPMSTEEHEWRDDLIRSVHDKEIRNFWQLFENQPRASQDRIVQPVMDRIWQLNARPELRNIIGQSKSSFQMDDIITGNKILLVNLSNIAKETASLTGTLLMNSIWHAVKTNKPGRPNFLYLDEFQDFINLPIDPEDMLAKARGFGLGMTLAHQHTSQLPKELRDAVLANARTKVVFQTTSNDATTMAREFGSSVEDHDLMHLGRFEAIARITTDDGVSSPVTLATSEPAKSFGHAKQLVQESRMKYGRPVGEVELEIEKRRSPSNASKRRKRPQIGGSDDGWGLPKPKDE